MGAISNPGTREANMVTNPIEATQITIEYKCEASKKVRAIDTNGTKWENFGDRVSPGLLAEVCAKIVAHRRTTPPPPSITLTTNGTNLIQSDEE
jgi:hypothetical protein